MFTEIISKVSATSPLEDWWYSIALNHMFLKIIGAWPNSLCSSTSEKVISTILVLPSTFLISFLLVPCALCTFLEKQMDLAMKIKLMGPLSFCIMSAIKHFILISRAKPLAKCMEHMKFDWTCIANELGSRGRAVMVDSAKVGRSLAMVCACFMYSGGFFYTTLMPLFAKRTEIIDNQTVRSPAFPIYRGLFDPRTSPFFEIVQLLQGLAGFIIYSVTVSACSLAAVFVMHACGQFKILVMKLDDIVSGVDKDNHKNIGDKRVGPVVEHHLRILNFVGQVEALLHEICLVELVGCTLNICFLGYYLLTEWEQNETIGSLTYFTLLLSFTFNIFIVCYIGEILTEQCKKVGLSVYMIKWYRLPGKRALDLKLILAVSNSSIKLTAGKFVDLSLTSFCNVVKSALAYLNLLRKLTFQEV